MSPMKKEIRNFLRDPDIKLKIIPYTGKRLTATLHWPRYRSRIRLTINGILHEILKLVPPSNTKNWIMRRMGYKIGKDACICNYTYLDPLFPEAITIDDGALIGAYAQIATHDMIHRNIRLGRVHIKKGAVIGGSSFIRSGVTVGENAVVGQNSMVYKDVPDNTIVFGVPAKEYKKLKPGQTLIWDETEVRYSDSKSSSKNKK